MHESESSQAIQTEMNPDGIGNHNGVMTRVRGERLSMYTSAGPNKNEY